MALSDLTNTIKFHPSTEKLSFEDSEESMSIDLADLDLNASPPNFPKKGARIVTQSVKMAQLAPPRSARKVIDLTSPPKPKAPALGMKNYVKGSKGGVVQRREGEGNVKKESGRVKKQKEGGREEEFSDDELSIEEEYDLRAHPATTKKILPTTPKIKQHVFEFVEERQSHFLSHREGYVLMLFKKFNEAVANNRLEKSFKIVWSGRLRTTAGRALLSRNSQQHMAEIELSSKILNSFEKLFQTICHELCHCTVWLIDHTKGDHGPLWVKWMRITKAHFPQLQITRCHNYET
eukprot:TRINITY_DN341_c0_g1_i1.p1 TRINITY_DN341_c0_g1~~TRINITY_DN341_c0_g1_i1.p1  ORF type:complete len:292 (+),score=70.20 TRINITY_DN341_c0_g1_i1:61-936(+)